MRRWGKKKEENFERMVSADGRRSFFLTGITGFLTPLKSSKDSGNSICLELDFILLSYLYKINVKITKNGVTLY